MAASFAVEGATVNDAAITIVGGALRRYLLDKHELPAESLVAMAPVNVRDTSEKGSGGNVVSTMAVKTHSEIADPVERLRAVHEGTRSAKELNQAVGAKAMTDYAQFIPSTLTAQAARLASRWHLANQISPFYNCVITNVPGPQVPLYCTGAKMLSNYGAGPCADSLGLFQVISSYCGDFTISATCCREMMPDPAFYRECLVASFEELMAATVGSRRQRGQPRTKAKTAKKSASKAKAKTGEKGTSPTKRSKAAKAAKKSTAATRGASRGKVSVAAGTRPKSAVKATAKKKSRPGSRPKAQPKARPKRAAG